MANLRQLSEHYEFGTTLNDMLRDRLVCGINNDQYQRRLLAEKKLTFEKDLELAQSMEAADKNVRVLCPTTSLEADVRQVLSPQHPNPKRPSGDRDQLPCYRWYHPATCRFRNTECSYLRRLDTL